jgi:heme oxygenase
MLRGQPLRRLKEATAELHLEAERFVRILDADATVDDYVRYLRAMHGYHAAIEPRFTVLDALGFASATRQRAQLAALDLRVLEGSPGERCHPLPAGSTTASVLGMAYVIEGSTLGGRFILTKLPAALAPLRGRATAFLTGYGRATGDRWRSFAAIVERELASPALLDEAVAGACATFTTLTRWLAHEGPHQRWREAS